jgi:hypothetical protein
VPAVKHGMYAQHNEQAQQEQQMLQQQDGWLLVR